MRATVSVDQLQIDKALYDFVNDEAMPGSGVQSGVFWQGFAALVLALGPRNAALLRRRDELQAKIDAWHRQSPGPGFDRAKYQAFLREIGYLVAHGVLHVLGYDHEAKADRARMRRREEEALRPLGFIR